MCDLAPNLTKFNRPTRWLTSFIPRILFLVIFDFIELPMDPLGTFDIILAVNRNRVFNLLYLAIFLISSALRLGLAITDRDPNDVVAIILQQNRLPLTGECEECFQPKVYYFIVAKAVEMAAINVHHEGSIALALQLMNFAAVELTIILTYIFIKQLNPKYEKTGLIAFALLAFNPALMTVSGTAFNDAFTILFSSVAIYLFWIYLQNEKWGWLAASCIFVSLSLATKTNTWSTAIAILIVLFIKCAFDRRMIQSLVIVMFILAVTLLTLLNPLSQYWTNIRNFGTPVTLNVVLEPLPSFFEKTAVRRPGILSIQDGFFTFKFIELMESPRLTLAATDYPAFRTSFWADIYGTANSVHFLNSPDEWHTKPDFEVTRCIFILAIIPTIALLLGMGISGIKLSKAIISSSIDGLRQQFFGLFDVISIGYIFFTIVLALRYRDYSTINAKYMYPGILAYIYLFIVGVEGFFRFISVHLKLISGLFITIILFLLVVYGIDVYHMIEHLYSLNVR